MPQSRAGRLAHPWIGVVGDDLEEGIVNSCLSDILEPVAHSTKPEHRGIEMACGVPPGPVGLQ